MLQSGKESYESNSQQRVVFVQDTLAPYVIQWEQENSFNVTAPAGRPAVVRAPKGLNLWEGPALSYEVLEVLPDGAEITALDLPMGAEVPGWRLVASDKGVGWVQNRFLRLEG